MSDAIIIRTSVPATTIPQLDFILMDGSGSMQENWWPMLKAVDAYVQTLKWDNINSHLIMDVFDDTDIAYRARDCSLADWLDFKTSPIGAHWGLTPLYDAIVMMGKSLRDLMPEKCAITIVTDGQNTSYANKFADLQMAKGILDWCRANDWQVTFLGCNWDNEGQAKELGANATNSIGVRRELLTDATVNYAKKRAAYGRSGQDINFTSDEKQKFGGYLGGPQS